MTVGLAVSALGLGAGASTSQANVGSVYFDNDFNVGAGETFFNFSFTGANNVGLNRRVMPFLTTGDNNVATGAQALLANTTGDDNVASGFQALFANTTGDDNVAAGRSALFSNTTGSANVALGSGAGDNLTTGSENVDIANGGQAGDSGTIRIGHPNDQTATFVAGISGTNVGGTPQPVVVKSNGQLGTAPAASASTASLATTVEQLCAQLKRQQRQIERLRARVKGG